MDTAIDAVETHVANHLAALQQIERNKGVVELHLTLRRPVLLGLDFLKAPGAVQVARHVDFAPKLHVLANNVVRRIHRQYNTRCEIDYQLGESVYAHDLTVCSMAHTCVLK